MPQRCPGNEDTGLHARELVLLPPLPLSHRRVEMFLSALHESSGPCWEGWSWAWNRHGTGPALSQEPM